MRRYKNFYMLIGVVSLVVLTGYASPILGESGGEEQAKAMKALTEKTVGETLGNFIAMAGGVIKNGEQIPLPVYQDGTSAKREECHYFVSPHEVTTALTGLSPTRGIYYIQCGVDQDGTAHISLKGENEQGGDGYDIAEDPGYKALQEHYDRHHISTLGGEEGSTLGAPGSGYQDAVIKRIRERLLANYFVIATRSQAGRKK